MAGDAHDVLVHALRDEPELLRSLVEKVTGKTLSGPWRVVDSTVRFTRSEEVRPDIVAMIGESWWACEVQNLPDKEKGRRWLLGVSALFNQTLKMGELIVITASAAVATWAKTVAHTAGPLGTCLQLTPLVVYLDENAIERLLDPEHPELAWCAVWAMRHRHGPVAQRVVERAVMVTDRLPASLQTTQLRAIFELLSPLLKLRLRKSAMSLANIPESPATKKLRLFIESAAEKRGLAAGLEKGLEKGLEEGRKRGRLDSLLMLLEQRGLAINSQQLATLRTQEDLAQLDAWFRLAVTVDSVEALLSTALPTKTVAPAKTKTRRGPNVRQSVQRSGDISHSGKPPRARQPQQRG